MSSGTEFLSLDLLKSPSDRERESLNLAENIEAIEAIKKRQREFSLSFQLTPIGQAWKLFTWTRLAESRHVVKRSEDHPIE